MDRICDYIHAFVARREQFFQLKAEKKLEDVLTSISYDLIQFKYLMEDTFCIHTL